MTTPIRNDEITVRLTDILRTIAGLSQSDIEVYKLLLHEYQKRNEPLTVSEIANIVGKSRSTIERSLMKLLNAGLVERKIALSRSGGYTYVYYPKPINEVKARLLEKLEEHYKKAVEILSNLEIVIGAEVPVQSVSAKI